MGENNTLACYSNHGINLKRNITYAQMPDVIDKMNSFIISMSSKWDLTPHPEREALRFYLRNHLVSLCRIRIPHKDMPLGDLDEIISAYYRETPVIAARAFYYLLAICTREARHNSAYKEFYTARENKYGKGLCDFFYTIKSNYGSTETYDYLKSNPELIEHSTLGDFTAILVDIFYNGSFSSGFGGKAWGAVADCLNNFVLGNYSGEMMLDTVWTLCHNNGPIFNKGMLYASYNHKDIITILDSQRAGYIPSLIKDVNTHGMGYLSSEYDSSLYEEVKKAEIILGEEFSYVDWYMVESLGAMGSYASYKTKQKNKFGISKSEEEYLKAKEKADKAMKLKKDAEYKELNKKYYFVTPTLKVKKLTREQLNASV